jgi:hypothetical protein
MVSCDQVETITLLHDRKTNTQKQEEKNMTNLEIITNATLSLIEAGVIGENEQIHTFADWKNSGYMVKKGSKAVAQFQIWRYTDKPGKAKQLIREAAGEDQEKPDPHYYMTKASFFSTSQVEKIKTA